MPVELNLPETAKALSAPVTKLIEVVAAGCGRLYEPTGIRRKARAEGDAAVILEGARGRVSELRDRAAQRLLDTEERRQQNIEAITEDAIKRLPGTVSDDPVDQDWAARFFSECQDISNEEMRSVWARLLAGEVARPGSFSPRTLWVLKNLTRREAQLFNELCKQSFRVGGVLQPMVGVPERSSVLEEHGLDFQGLQRLVDAGLTTWHDLGLLWDLKVEALLLIGSKVSLMLKSPSPHQFSLGYVSFTSAGLELAEICEWDIPEARLNEIEGSIAAPLSSVRVEVIDRLPDGRVRFKPL